MASRYDKYKVARGDDIGDPTYWNRRFRDVDTRIAAVEDQKQTLDDVIEEGRTVFRTRVDEILVPLVQEVADVAELGALLRAHSSTEVEVTAGGKTFFVDEADRLRFAAPAYLSIMATGNPALALSGALVSYASATGELVVDVDQVEGAGWGADWTISVGNTTDAVADAAAASAARDATFGYRTEVEQLTLLASSSAEVATTKAGQAVEANSQAQSAKDTTLILKGDVVSAIAQWDSAVLPPSSVAPAARPGGTPLQIGDQYFSPADNFWRTWNGIEWTVNAVPVGSEVTSVYGRVGSVSARLGDYRGDQISRTTEQQAVVAGATTEDAIITVSDLVTSEAAARAAADATKADKTVTVTGTGLVSGGGDLSASRTLTVTKATQAQAQDGTNDTTAMTPVRVKDAIATLVPAASTTVSGRSRLATTSEATTGTAVDIAVTPAGLKAATDAVKNTIISGAGAALDTLSELAAALGNDANFAATITTQISLKLNTSATSAWARGGLLSAADAPTARTYLGLDSAATYSAASFAAAAHSHVVADVTGLQTAIDAKLATSAFTASAVLTLLKSVDGSGSDLDADKLRGTTPSTFGLELLSDADAATALSGLGISGQTDATWTAGTGTTESVISPTKLAAAIAALANNSLLGVKAFTESGTYTPTEGATKALVIITGGGGSGAMGQVCSSGGAGATAVGFINGVTTQTVTIGAGGTKKTSNGAGNDGGTTSFGSLITAGGGQGGTYLSSPAATGSSETTGAVLSIRGGDGEIVSLNSIYPSYVGARGGASFWGGGGAGSVDSVNAPWPKAYGAGGGLATTNVGASGYGQAGVALILEFA